MATASDRTATEIKFWDEGWTPEGTIEIPPGYARLPAGSPFATRLAKKLTKESGRTVFVQMKHSKRGGYSSPVACWVPQDIIPEVQRAEEESAERRTTTREAAKKTRARRHERDLERLAARLGELYPGMPEGERRDVVERAFEVGSERVGRTTKLDEERKLELAVRAHVRHTHTAYDEMLAGGWDREEVRHMLKDEIESIIAERKGKVT